MVKVIAYVKAVAYLCSVILPVLDALKGVKNGVKQAIADEKAKAANRDIEMFYRDNEVQVDFDEIEEENKK